MLCIFKLILNKLLIFAYELLVKVGEKVTSLLFFLIKWHIAFTSLRMLVFFGKIRSFLCNAFRTLLLKLSDFSFNIFDLFEDNLNVDLIILYIIDHQL